MCCTEFLRTASHGKCWAWVYSHRHGLFLCAPRAEIKVLCEAHDTPKPAVPAALGGATRAKPLGLPFSSVTGTSEAKVLPAGSEAGLCPRRRGSALRRKTLTRSLEAEVGF